MVIVEDNRLFRETLELLLGLRSEIDVVGSAEGGTEAAELCGELRPDVALIDYRMPGLDGAQATRAVLSAAPAVKVVCLTASVSASETQQLLDAGAVSCLMKDDGFDEIVAAVVEAAAA